MWDRDIIFILVSCTCCIAFVGAGEICNIQYKDPKWEPDESKAPGSLKLGAISLPENGTKSKKIIGLKVQVEDITEDFKLFLLARPFVKDKKCPPAASEYEQLQRFHKPYIVKMGDKPMREYYFGQIFTGCYYFEMENKEGKKWIWDPCFYEGNYHFYDRMLKCEAHDFIHPNIEQPRQLVFKLQVPLTCLKLKCKLFELDGTDHNTIDDLNAGKIPAKQTCWVTRRGIHQTLQVECMRPDTKLNLAALPGDEIPEGWKTTIEWEHLKIANAKYYSMFELYNDSCNMSYADIMTWMPVIKFGAISHDRNGSNILDPKPPSFLQSETMSIILFVILGFTVPAVLVYWVTRYVRIMLDKKRRSNNLFVKPQETVQLYHLNESDEILLIYARESPEFMKAMDALRERLRKICHFKVRDVYATNEWSLVAELGATRWVEDRLREGSKVVWVDTPQFRSIVTNNNLERHAQNQYDTIDFRDEAIPYAVTLATHLFQNAITQYRQHFVIRLEGFKVEDGSDDPLLAVSPHARYCIPEHLDLLDKHLAR